MEFNDCFESTIREIFGYDENSPFAGGNTVAQEQAETEDKGDGLDTSLVRLGDTYLHLRHYDYAMDCFREAVRINPDNTMAFNRLIVIPSHLLENKPHGQKNLPQINANDKRTLRKLTLNDAFRQTFIGGYVVLSKLVSQLPDCDIKGLFNTIQNLENRYFEKRGGRMRDHGIIKYKTNSFFWVINHCYNSPVVSEEKCPVLLLMTRYEYRKLKSFILKYILRKN